MATITISATNNAEAVSYPAPDSVLDMSVETLTSGGMSRALAVGIASVALRLYAHGRVELGYGINATIEGQA